jgi:hypothetical protein
MLLAPAFLNGGTADFAGHWEGSTSAQNQQFPFQIDLVASAKGEIRGTIRTEDSTSDIPLKIEMTERKIKFYTRTDQEFSGELSTDGQTITGEYAIAGYLLPFRIERTGDGTLGPALTSPPIPKGLEGSWESAIDVSGSRFRLRLSMRNENTNSAIGVLVSVDEGGLEVPMSIHAEASSEVTLDAPSIKVHFVGALDVARDEITGILTLPGFTGPVTFHREK